MYHYNKLMDGSKIVLAGHRGDRKNFPENTMPAFKAAVEMGLGGIETDVRMTKDGVLVLIHDRSVERTTTGTGFVDEMTLDEILALDAGSKKDPKFKGIKIPTVEEFLQYVSKTDILINWELKEYVNDLGERAFTCIDKLVALIKKYGMVERSMINSFSELDLEYVNDNYPEFVVHGYLNYSKTHPFDFSKKPLESFSDWTAVWYKPEGHVAGLKEDYEYAIKNGVLPCILVPDTVEAYKEALDLGCLMFTSDDPEKALSILKDLKVL